MENLGRLFESRYDLVLKAARRYAPDTSLTYDIAQQTFLVFVDGVREKGWTSDGNLDALLYSIARRVAQTLWKQEQKNRSSALEVVAGHFLKIQRETPESAERETGDATEKLIALKVCMDKLTARSRSFLELYYRSEITLEEIGKQNRINPGTIRQLFSRLRATLRDCIEKTLKQENDKH